MPALWKYQNTRQRLQCKLGGSGLEIKDRDLIWTKKVIVFSWFLCSPWMHDRGHPVYYRLGHFSVANWWNVLGSLLRQLARWHLHNSQQQPQQLQHQLGRKDKEETKKGDGVAENEDGGQMWTWTGQKRFEVTGELLHKSTSLILIGRSGHISRTLQQTHFIQSTQLARLSVR